MKSFVFTLVVAQVLIGGTLVAPSHSQAEGQQVRTKQWTEDRDGEIGPNEFRVIDPNGAVTRRPCPYTCGMRGIPKSQCRQWPSAGAAQGECYVHDLRVSRDDAMPRMPAHGQSARAQWRQDQDSSKRPEK